jgi:hypothetical protein
MNLDFSRGSTVSVKITVGPSPASAGRVVIPGVPDRKCVMLLKTQAA